MSTRNAARNVRQRKLNTKQPLRIVHEEEVEEWIDEDGQRHIPQVETGVEKGEEIEYHLQAVINAANAATTGAKSKASYIPTPEATKARGVQYDKLYPKSWPQPSTYIRFSSTVEDSVGSPYCMDDDDISCLGRLNDGKTYEGHNRNDKLKQCSEDTFEEVISFFEETSQRNQPFVNIDNAPIMSCEEMEQSVDETLSADGRDWLKAIYPYWAMKKGSRALMPTIKVKVLDTTSEADDADPYVCFRRREVRQTRKTRGRDAQVVEKLKKLRLELESARSLVQMIVQRETLNKDHLEISRKVFEQRGQLKKVKIDKNIVGEKGEDEELLINQKPIPKPKPRQSLVDQRPGPTIRIRTGSERQASEGDLLLLETIKADSKASVQQQIRNRKIQHQRWNEHWQDRTWSPITPSDAPDKASGWGFLQSQGMDYPTPPPTLPSEGSQKEDTEMLDVPAPLSPPKEMNIRAAASPDPEILVMSMPGAYPQSPYERHEPDERLPCRLRRGRGGRWYLESKKKRPPRVYSGVVTDSDFSDSDDDAPAYHSVSDRIIFDYRCALNRSAAKVEAAGTERKPSAESVAPNAQQHASSG